MSDTSDKTESSSTSDDKQTLSILHILTSVLAAAVGVQSKKNQEKDFNGKGSIYIYIAAGIIFTVLFVITIVTVVKSILAGAGM
ncbi:MAG: DUF2970 domain-containing protein [Cellvibrionales bacterium]|jgi:uncharacterized membrane protein YidH (DUF202 family)|nr:DUF2970 domain-containing protein [Cellvibrionales bacterium]MBT5922221.1 DUF2970 domain-containing protein [Cellvibrionales bacterium]MBT6579057.1 DUF2970 domain-containing protein [Cellvibrionales bacterium]